MSTYLPKNWRGQKQLGSSIVCYICCTLMKERTHFHLYTRAKERLEKICLSIQNHGFKSIFIALLEMALSCWYFGALKGQMVTGVSKITRIRILAGLIFLHHHNESFYILHRYTYSLKNWRKWNSQLVGLLFSLFHPIASCRKTNMHLYRPTTLKTKFSTSWLKLYLPTLWWESKNYSKYVHYM